MAIRFRCPYCQTLQSIANRKAGLLVRCAACDDEVLVPLEDQVEAAPQPSASPPPAVATVREPDEDRVALPDSFFDDDDDIAPQPERKPRREMLYRSQTEPEEEIVFDTAAMQTMDWIESTEDRPAAAGERPRSSRRDKLPEQFELKIRKSRIDDEMDLTPMVDVVFQLLIFFMVTASFALHKTIETPTPDPDQKGATQSIQTLEELEGVAILVRIDGQNGITIDDEPLPEGARVADALLDKMRAEQKSEIIITADAAAWHRTVVNVVDAANSVGMQKIRLATRSSSEE
jgi:biopolymer transport protein ExbD